MEVTLYKAASNGKPVQWTIEVHEGAYRTSSGYVGGAITTSEWTQCKPKNVGKANETTAEQQAIMEAQSKITRKKEEGYTEDLQNVAEAKASAWKEPMLAYLIEKRPKAIKPGMFIAVQPKLDGVRCILTREGMFSREGKPIVSCPHILDQGQRLLNRLPAGTRLDGELYNHDFKDDFNALVSLIRKGTALSYENQQKVQYHLYDLDMPDVSYIDRWVKLDRLEDHGLYPQVRIVPTEFVEVEDTWKEYVERMQTLYIEQGYEGAIVRNAQSFYENKRSDNLLKVKTFQDDEFTILEVLEGEGNRSNMAGKLVVQLKDGQTCEAGIAGGVSFYRELWEKSSQLIGKLATVRFFGYTPAGKLRFPVVKQVDRQDL